MVLGPREQAFLQEGFHAYYATRPALRVRGVDRREWMLVGLDGRLQRHLSYASQDEIHEDLATRVPMHAYHSMAFYEDPGHPDMASKDRRDCEVLVDVDVKPSRGSDPWSLNDSLALAKGHFIRALDLLERDLGVAFGDLEACFSGSKGFHARLVDEAALALDAQARLEVGRFLGGQGVTLRGLFPSRDPSTATIPAQAPAGGLRRRVWQALHRIKALSEPRSRPAALLELVSRYDQGLACGAEGVLDAIHEAPSIQALVHDQEQREVLRILFHAALAQAGPAIDLPVMGDLARMARLQGSINGATGLVATPIASREALEVFDPLVDANPHPRDSDVAIEGLTATRLQVGSLTTDIQEGQTASVPVCVAVPLVAMGAARLPDRA